MNILQIISSGGMYGAESVILNLSRVLTVGAHPNVLGVFANASNPNLQLHERAAQEGIASHLIPCRSQFDQEAISYIRELAGRVGVDVVHSHGYKADVYAYLALHNHNCSLVATCHNWIDEDLRAFLYGVTDRYVLRRFDRVVAVSDEVKKRLLAAGVSEERVAVVRNGIDLRRFSAAAPPAKHDGTKNRLVIGLVGRLSREKGLDTFLRAASIVVTDYPDAEFVVVGDGPQRNELERLIDELKIDSSVSLVGRLDDMPSVYRSFDVMVSSSRREGLPIAILEGMAAGLPVIATAVGEVPRIIRDGETGVLVPPEDQAALAEAIVTLLVDCQMRKRLGCAARRSIERDFSAERMTADYLQIYEDAIAIHAGKSKLDGVST